MPGEEHEPDVVTGRYDPAIARRILRYIARFPRLAFAALGLALAIALVAAAPPYLFGRAIDAGIVGRDPGVLVRFAALYLCAEAARLVLGYAQGLAITRLGLLVILDLRMDLGRRLTHQSLAFFAREPVGRLVTRVTHDVLVIGEAFSGGAIAVVGDVFAILVAGGVLVWLEPRLALFTFAVLPLLYVSVRKLNERIRDTSRALRKLLARVAAYLAETLNGIRVVQLFGREAENARRFCALNDDHLHVQLQSMRYHALYVSTITVITQGAVAVLLWRGGNATLGGSLEIGLFIAFIGYTQFLFLPIRDIAEKYATFQAAMASAERVFRLMDERVDIVPVPEPVPVPDPLRGEVEFRGVSFRYSGTGTGTASERPWALRHVSFKIPAGQRVAIVGHTGAGKSTVVNLLGRFHDATEGEVLVDGVNVRDLDERALRREIGVVLQDVFIFPGTVLENIGLGDARVGEDTARAAARAVGIEALLGRRAATLSTGQKQLVSFARALAFDPKVLVLDEATASVDPETESQLQAAIAAILRGRTSIVIAHRLATVQDVERVLVFHKGELREDGSPRELLARGGIFARLYRLQAANLRVNRTD